MLELQIGWVLRLYGQLTWRRPLKYFNLRMTYTEKKQCQIFFQTKEPKQKLMKIQRTKSDLATRLSWIVTQPKYGT